LKEVTSPSSVDFPPSLSPTRIKYRSFSQPPTPPSPNHVEPSDLPSSVSWPHYPTDHVAPSLPVCPTPRSHDATPHQLSGPITVRNRHRQRRRPRLQDRPLLTECVELPRCLQPNRFSRIQRHRLHSRKRQCERQRLLVLLPPSPLSVTRTEEQLGTEAPRRLAPYAHTVGRAFPPHQDDATPKAQALELPSHIYHSAPPSEAPILDDSDGPARSICSPGGPPDMLPPVFLNLCPSPKPIPTGRGRPVSSSALVRPDRKRPFRPRVSGANGRAPNVRRQRA
jgi:hypothetical protein